MLDGMVQVGEWDGITGTALVGDLAGEAGMAEAGDGTAGMDILTDMDTGVGTITTTTIIMHTAMAEEANLTMMEEEII